MAETTRNIAFIDAADTPRTADSYKSVHNHYLDTLHTVDIRHGGQWGVLPRIGNTGTDGKKLHEWMHEQVYLKRDVVPVLLQAPRGFELLPTNGTDWKEAVKALFEVHAKTIEGLNSSLTVEHQEHALGLSGATVREPGNVNREATSITVGVTERYGNPFEKLLDVWIRFLIMDPDLKYPLITQVAGNKMPEAWTAEWYTATAIFIEPDPLYKKPVHAWLVSNMYPSANPDIIGKKDKSAGREMKEISIDFGGFALPTTNVNVMNLAAKMLTTMKLWTYNPDIIELPADTVEPDIAEAVDKDIYFEGIKTAAAPKTPDATKQKEAKK